MNEINKCPECSADLVRRSGKYGDFYACSEYPNCKFTRKIDSEPAVVKKSSQNGLNKEFHLTPEQVRTNALNLAVNHATLLNMNPTISKLKEMAEEYRRWIDGE